MSNKAIDQLLTDCKGILGALNGKSKENFLEKVMSLNDDKEMVLDNLFTGLVAVFSRLDEVSRVRFLSPLVDLVDAYKQRTTSGFDYEQAKKIRESKGVTREDLSKIVKIHPLTIFKMEKADLPFSVNKPKHQAWMTWLVENGYKVDAVV